MKLTNEQRAARMAAILPTYVFRRERPLPAGHTIPEAECATHEELSSLITDALHFAASKGWNVAELASEALLEYAKETLGDSSVWPMLASETQEELARGEAASETSGPLRVFYVCPCGKEWSEENGPEYGACDSECECGETVEADRFEDIDEEGGGE